MLIPWMFWLPNNLLPLPQKTTWFRQIGIRTCGCHTRVSILKRSAEPSVSLTAIWDSAIDFTQQPASLKYEASVLGRHKCIQSPTSVLLPHLFVSPCLCIKMFTEELKFNMSIHLMAFDYIFCEGRNKPFQNGKQHTCLPSRMVSGLCFKEIPKHKQHYRIAEHVLHVFPPCFNYRHASSFTQ